MNLKERNTTLTHARAELKQSKYICIRRPRVASLDYFAACSASSFAFAHSLVAIPSYTLPSSPCLALCQALPLPFLAGPMLLVLFVRHLLSLLCPPPHPNLFYWPSLLLFLSDTLFSLISLFCVSECIMPQNEKNENESMCSTNACACILKWMHVGVSHDERKRSRSLSLDCAPLACVVARHPLGVSRLHVCFPVSPQQRQWRFPFPGQHVHINVPLPPPPPFI